MSISQILESEIGVSRPRSHWRLVPLSVAKTAMERTMSLAEATGRRLAKWSAERRLSGYSDAFLKDIGVPRGCIEDAVRNGRPDRFSKR
jgi:hypothetical protein